MLWIILSVVFVLILVLSYCCYWIAFYNPESRHRDPVIVPPGAQYEQEGERIKQLMGEMDRIPYERVYITSRDGLRLSAKYYHISDEAPLQIQFHGYRGSGIRDFCGGNKLARDMGHNTLVVDQRAHGESGGRTMTFGIKERFDCLDWVNYANERFGGDRRIFLSGVSMGAATVLMASELDLPSNVLGIIADCGYSSPGAIIRKVCRDIRIPPALGYPFVVLGGLIYGHFKIWESDAVRAVANGKVPVLLIHGEDDKFVPCDMSRQIYGACREPKFLETFPGAGHGISYMTDTSRYEKIVRDFLNFCTDRRKSL